MGKVLLIKGGLRTETDYEEEDENFLENFFDDEK